MHYGLVQHHDKLQQHRAEWKKTNGQSNMISLTCNLNPVLFRHTSKQTCSAGSLLPPSSATLKKEAIAIVEMRWVVGLYQDGGKEDGEQWSDSGNNKKWQQQQQQNYEPQKIHLCYLRKERG